MTLTPQEVREKQFTTVKMRTGYDMDEVDTFLDSVESALGALIVDNDDLRAQLASKPAAAVTSGEAEKKLTEAQAKVAEADRKVAEAERKVSESNKALADAQAKLVDADRKLVAVADREKAAEAKLTEARRMATATVAPTATAAAAAMAAPSPGSAKRSRGSRPGRRPSSTSPARSSTTSRSTRRAWRVSSGSGARGRW